MQDGHKPQCSGLGVMDCTGECAGTEAEFKHFMEVTNDKDFDKKFPELAKLKATDKMEELKTKHASVHQLLPRDYGSPVPGKL